MLAPASVPPAAPPPTPPSTPSAAAADGFAAAAESAAPAAPAADADAAVVVDVTTLSVLVLGCLLKSQSTEDFGRMLVVSGVITRSLDVVWTLFGRCLDADERVEMVNTC